MADGNMLCCTPYIPTRKHQLGTQATRLFMMNLFDSSPPSDPLAVLFDAKAVFEKRSNVPFVLSASNSVIQCLNGVLLNS